MLGKTAKGNLLLKQKQGENPPAGIQKMFVYEGSRKKAVIFDTIASVENPLYLAKPIAEGEGAIPGTIMSSKPPARANNKKAGGRRNKKRGGKTRA